MKAVKLTEFINDFDDTELYVLESKVDGNRL